MITAKGLTCGELRITNEKLTSLDSLRFYDVRKTPEFRLYGLLASADGTSYVRIPEAVAEKTTESLCRENRTTTGGRLRFVTDSDYIAFSVFGSASKFQSGITHYAASGFDVYMKRSGKYVFLNTVKPPMTHDGSFVGMLLKNEMPKGRKEITVNFPLFNNLTDLYIGLDKNSTLEIHPDYKYEQPVLFYGSSITHGAAASRPGLAYPLIISRRYDTNILNLGFSGSAKAEDAIIEYLASLDPSVFVLDYDHNAPTAEHLAATHEKLYLAFRKAHPETPVIMVSMPNGKDDNREHVTRRDIIFNTYKNARARDEKVIFIDGMRLFGADGHDECTTDGIHPNDIGMMRMADVIGKAVDYALSI